LCSFFVYLSRIRYKSKMPVLHVSAVVLSTAPTVFRTQASSSTTPCGGHGEVSVSQANPCIACLGTHTPVDATRSPSVSSSWTSSNRVRRLQVQARHEEPLTIRTVPVQVAHELINAGHHYLDVRTAEEFAAGHVEGSVNIPYLVKMGPGMSKNLKFVEDVSREFDKDDEIVVACQSGRRSLMAAAELRAANFSGVTDMGGGYSAWKESGLPVQTHRAQQAHKA
jgi:rhodanese-related sulfurtransferase